ncbi:3-hydroxyanthranilate 3,4-dioxygenase [Streptosporangium sp. NBC_01810]|uniref:3-hydroxyanthranilate 3,4-dioxygenase n=1 Tax=Streptosporangium sp. NBC_01810 TaxID=2975951 RepID=UPI002DD9CC2A|nr:3-hydroxyanthranilate 3,4-dioxygenase [Streptosporangium sp. NBC_01810]WSA25513.1 3-hydroxyanthranilate 3,4-dioxygenase [Streptosporangium sp. NBC_01810]
MIPPIDFTKWIDEHAHLLKPPVGNKVIFEGANDLIVMVVGGPNARTDFHIDPYEELFYQVRGNMHVNVMTPEGPDTVHIREGQMWLLPPNLPHSPQRPEEGSVGFLVERIRPEGMPEKFRWYCQECSAVVHEVELQVRDIVTDLPPIFQAFYDDEKARTCGNCGAVHPGKG